MQLDDVSGPAGEFVTTHWSVVLAAGDEESPSAAQALERLCQVYWKPLYAYVRRQGHGIHEAQDLTQEFFARLLEKQYLQLADPGRGRFRTFLLTSLKRFLINEWKHASRQKRGGGQKFSLLVEDSEAENSIAEPSEGLTPEQIYEQRWATSLLEEVIAKLRRDYAAAGMEKLFDELKVYIWGEKNALSYADIASQLGLSDGAVKVAAHRLRNRFRLLLRAEVANTVSDPSEVDDELRHLFEIVAR